MGEGRVMGLHEIYELAERESRAIRVGSIGLEAATEGEKAARSARLPQVNLSLSGSYISNATLMSRGFSTSGTTDVILAGLSVLLLGIILHRLRTVEQPLLSLRIFTYRNVVAILAVVALAELLLGAKHCLEEILYVEVFHLEEHTKEEQYLWALPGVYVGVVISLLWLKVFKWKIWKLLGIGFACILGYAVLMYVNLDVHTNLEQFRLAIALRGCAYCILSSSLMWALHESVHELFEFFMGLFVFNIIHMYLAGAAGYGFYTSIFSHFLSDNMARYGSHLTLTGLDMTTFNFPAFMEHDFLPSMMAVAIKRSYGIIIWISLFATMTFFLLDIPAVRTNVRRVPIWAVAGIEYLAKLSGLRRRS